MLDHGYDVKRSGDDVVDRNLDSIKNALDTIVKALPNKAILTFVVAGNNGVGSIALIPPKMPNGSTPLYRAMGGSKLIAAIDLSSLVNLQTSFEQTLKNSDSIRQLDSTNLSAHKIAFLFQQ